MSNTQMVEITVRADEDQDDCLTAAAEAYIAEHPELREWDLAPRFTDGDRETVTLTIPLWATVSREQIISLRKEATAAGDYTQADVCGYAIAGDIDSWRECACVIIGG